MEIKQDSTFHSHVESSVEVLGFLPPSLLPALSSHQGGP